MKLSDPMTRARLNLKNRGPGAILLEGLYDVIHDVIIYKSNVFADLQGSRLFSPLVENVLTQMHIQVSCEKRIYDVNATTRVHFY